MATPFPLCAVSSGRLWLPHRRTVDRIFRGQKLVDEILLKICKGESSYVRFCALGVLQPDSDSIVLFHRPSYEQFFPDSHCCAGGHLHVSKQETPLQALRREYLQETGCAVTVKQPLGVHNAYYPEQNVLFIIHLFAVGIRGEMNIVLNREHDSFCQISIQHARQLRLAGSFMHDVLHTVSQSPLH